VSKVNPCGRVVVLRMDDATVEAEDEREARSLGAVGLGEEDGVLVALHRLGVRKDDVFELARLELGREVLGAGLVEQLEHGTGLRAQVGPQRLLRRIQPGEEAVARLALLLQQGGAIARPRLRQLRVRLEEVFEQRPSLLPWCLHRPLVLAPRGPREMEPGPDRDQPGEYAECNPLQRP
jgi:hypothetical protein